MLKAIRITFIASLFLLFGISACNPSTQKSETNNQPISALDAKIDSLISQMSVEEKAGQMTQINIALIQKRPRKEGEAPLDEAKLNKALLQKNVGSILNAMVGDLTMKDWHWLITQIQDVATQETKNKIPVLYGVDAIHGATYIENGTLFPHNIGIGASRNTELARVSAKITAAETRASGVRWNFDPVFDIGRQPLWARFPETYGEDAYIVGEMGVAAVNGYEEDGLKNPTAVASCMKHFVGYSNPKSGWDRTPAYIPEIELREHYLPQFQKAIDAGSSTIMINSGEVNGIPVHASSYLLTEVLRKEMGFEGLVVSDWEDVIMLHTKHKVAKTPKEAVKVAVDAGLDMSMVPMDYSFYDYLVELVNEGAISEERLNESVKRILKLKFELGLFDNPYPEEEAKKLFGKKEHQEEALKSAQQTITLLKNKEQVLPLTKDKKVLLLGPGANNRSSLHGCWSYSWQGNEESLYDTSTILTIKESFEKELGKENVWCKSVTNYNDSINYTIPFQDKELQSVDVIILCLGENAYAETPGSIKDLRLDKNQIELAKKAKAIGKPMILLLTEGRPRIIADIEEDMDGVLMAYWPGNRGAEAITSVIFGDYNPSAILPFTYPKTSGHQMLYDHKFSETGLAHTQGGYTYEGYTPQYPFGHGLSYTNFKYSNITISSDTIGANDTLQVSIEVTNTGNQEGVAVFDIFIRDHYATVVQPWKKVVRFNRTPLDKGTNKTVTFKLFPKDLSIVNRDLKRVIEEGAFSVMIKDQKIDFYYKP